MPDKILWTTGILDEMNLFYERVHKDGRFDAVLAKLEEQAMGEARKMSPQFRSKDGQALTEDAFDALSDANKEAILCILGRNAISIDSSNVFTSHSIDVQTSPVEFSQCQACAMLNLINYIEKNDGSINEIISSKITINLWLPLGGTKGLMACFAMITMLFPWVELNQKVMERDGNIVVGGIPGVGNPVEQTASSPKINNQEIQADGRLTPIIYCIKCGKQTKKQQLFCIHCGAAIVHPTGVNVSTYQPENAHINNQQPASQSVPFNGGTSSQANTVPGKNPISISMRKIKTASIAAFISAGITLVLTVISLTGESIIPGVNAFAFIDIILICVLAITLLLRKSRVSAIVLFSYFVVSKLYSWITMGAASFNVTGFATAVIFGLLYFQGVTGTIQYHKLKGIFKKSSVGSTM